MGCKLATETRRTRPPSNKSVMFSAELVTSIDAPDNTTVPSTPHPDDPPREGDEVVAVNDVELENIGEAKRSKIRRKKSNTAVNAVISARREEKTEAMSQPKDQ